METIVILSNQLNIIVLNDIISTKIEDLQQTNAKLKLESTVKLEFDKLTTDFLQYVEYYVLISKSDYRDEYYKQNCDSFISYFNEFKTKLEDILKNNSKEISEFIVAVWLYILNKMQKEAYELNYNYKLIEDAWREINYLYQNNV